VHPVVEPLRTQRERRHELVGTECLARAGHHAEVDDAVREQLGVDAQIPVPVQGAEHGVGDAADSDLQCGAVRDALHDRRGDGSVPLVGLGRRDFDERPLALGPSEDLRHVDLVEAVGARHARIDLEEERHLADEAATYSALVPRLKYPWRSGGLAAASTIEQRVSVCSRCGISEK
jgi:hypothetical protein